MSGSTNSFAFFFYGSQVARFEILPDVPIAVGNIKLALANSKYNLFSNSNNCDLVLNHSKNKVVIPGVSDKTK